MKVLLAAIALLLLPAAATAETLEVEPGISLYVERIGRGHQVIIVPGGFLYYGALQVLARPDRTLVLYDMRNRGRSSRVENDAQISLQADVADLEAVRRHVGAERTSLIGYSYLGMMTMLYAAEHPSRVDRVVQLGPVPMRFGTEYPADMVWRDSAPVIPADREAEVVALRERGYDRSNPQDYCIRFETLMRLRLIVDPRHADRMDPRIRCTMENEWPINFQRHLTIHFRGSVQNFEPPREALRALDIPVLTLHGTMDRNASFAGGAEWAMTLRNGRLIIVPRAAHQLWLDDPQALADVDRFLGGSWPARARSVRSWEQVRAHLPQGLTGPAL